MSRKKGQSFQSLGKAIKDLFLRVPEAPKNLKEWIFTFRGGITILCLIGVIIVPLITMDAYIINILIVFMIFSIFAASWDLLAGYAGQPSFGHSLFFGMAGYIAAVLVKGVGIPWFFSLILGALVGVLIGLVIGIPCLRLKGPYLSLGTQAFALILFYLFMSSEFLGNIHGGTLGIAGLPPISEDILTIFFSILVVMILSFVVLTLVVKSNLGTIFQAIRDDETGAEASGINTTRYKLIAFMISGFFAGIAGSLYALYMRSINPSVFLPLISFYAIVIAAIGGIATISGSIVGSFLFFVVFNEIFKPLGAFGTIWLYFPTLILAIFLILIIRYAEHGLLNPALERLKEFYDFIRGR